MTSSASFTSSASLELMQSQQKCFRPNFAARFGSCSVSWRKIIVKSGGRTAVEARPERRFANRLATGERHAFVIIRRAADHVGVRFDVFHALRTRFSIFGHSSLRTAAPLPVALAIGFVVGSLNASKTFFAFCFLLPFNSPSAARKAFQPEIILAIRAFHAVEKRGEFDELVPRVEKIEVENLLPCHGLSLNRKSKT